jgi:hypothetical protein
MTRRESPLFFSRENEFSSPKSGNYATPADYCRLFNERLTRFYTLSLLLTGNPEKAEECFTRSLDACLTSRGTFKGWEERLATHTIIKEAINMIGTNPARVAGQIRRTSEVEILAAALAKLTGLDRCVYVMSVLENYSDRECAIFLGCSAIEVRSARERGMKTLAEMEVLTPIQYPEPPLRAISKTA